MNRKKYFHSCIVRYVAVGRNGSNKNNKGNVMDLDRIQQLPVVTIITPFTINNILRTYT